MYEDITREDIISSLKCIDKWKSPGIDKLQTFGSTTYELVMKHFKNP